MIQVDGAYLYRLGTALHPVETLRENTRSKDAWLPIIIASGELERFLTGSVYSVAMRACKTSGNALLAVLKEVGDKTGKKENAETPLGSWDAYRVTKALGDFETVLAAEFGLMPILMVTPKRGYDLRRHPFPGSALEARPRGNG